MGSRNTSLSGIAKEVAIELSEHHADFEIANVSTPINQLILNANIYICDISAVVSECIAANAPIFIYIPRNKTINIARSNMDYEDYAYTFSSIEELCEKLQQVLSGDDYLMGARKKALNYLISEKETLRDEFFVQLRKISSKGALAQ
jgi:CDP-glycerol glycerophosphotransferase (TagB/SpsB family)